MAPIAPRLKRLFSQSLSILKKYFFLDRRAKIIFLPILYCFTKQKICGLSLNFCRIFNRFRCCISKQFKHNYFSIKINENNVCNATLNTQIFGGTYRSLCTYIYDFCVLCEICYQQKWKKSFASDNCLVIWGPHWLIKLQIFWNFSFKVLKGMLGT